ncbi:cytochrome b/b6 domain-containing protein [Sneathiella marina]|uniref:Cytochrome b/b6 domain-containing protein n=1 Tax=Sneathiella marina TaxID=2950108 RepID=A0ABY4W5C4_9PROT|nr:cytochrome b/b6 domain-containing protein [Sneathiella marina]USG61097.1 cytochrome b/b6 domain-containing protein [Sneathiella marina]
MLINTRERYGLIAQLFHWLTACLILILIPLGLFMVQLPINTTEEVGDKFWFYSLHKTLGMTLFAVAALRILWAVFQPHPVLLNSENKLENLAAQTIHWTLYGAIILMPLTGWMHHSALEGFAPIWGPFPQDLPFIPKNLLLASVFGTAHVFTAILLGISIFLHVGGALKHTLIDRDSTLARMVPGRVPTLPDDLPKPPFQWRPLFLSGILFAFLGTAVAINTVVEGSGNQSSQVIPENARNSEYGWRVDHDKSTLAIEVVQSGAQVSGSFANWKAKINFDAENLGASYAIIDIDVSSLTLGGISQQALSSNFLNAAAFPLSNFTSDNFIETETGTYVAQGQLTLVGQTKPLSLPFSLKIENNRAFVDGKAVIQRLEFDIGKKGYPDGQQIGLEVLVNVKIEAEKISR